MRFAEVVVISAVLIGFAIGRWFEHDRIGGTAHMRRQRDSARRAADIARAQHAQLLELNADAPTTAAAAVATVHRVTPLLHRVDGGSAPA